MGEKMGSETNSPTPSPNGKRSRDLEDEVYIDNLHSHKRYLSEMMASSLNCLTVGDPIPENILESPARSENMFYLRDELSMQYSPMSEDLDDARYCETPMSACSSQSESRPTSPVSPYRYKPVGAFCSSPPSTSQHSSGCTAFSGSSQPRQRSSDTDGRFPSSPSDICHSGDLRKAALLRSVQMRAQPSCSSAFDLGFSAMHNVEAETRSCSYLKPLEDEREFHDGCPVMSSSDPEFDQGKDSMGMNMGEFDQGKDSIGMNMGEFHQGKYSIGMNMGEFDQQKDSMGMNMGEFDERKDPIVMNMGEFDERKDPIVMNMGEFNQGKDSMGLDMGDFEQGKGSMGLNMGEFDRGKDLMGLSVVEGERSVKSELDAI